MYVDYSKLWKLLSDCRMNKTQLKKVSGISYNVLAKLSRNEFVSMESLFRIGVVSNGELFGTYLITLIMRKLCM